MNNSSEVRVRIAPSPTGDPHVGTAYVALFNMVFARQQGGRFILRIEDTDQTRARTTSEAMISETLQWLGLVHDEGPDVGGDFGPYRQSERLPIYREHCASLVAKGAAYPCFCSAEQLEQMRAQARAEGRNPGYDRRCRDLSDEEGQLRVASGESHVIRLKMPLEGNISFRDELRGEVTIPAQQLDDQVLLKTDGFPTYHLANVVDDHLMRISHVMRAEEWISSTPKHVQLYKAFGWNEPEWIHLPLLRNNDKSKISKRKNPVSLNYYRRAGILPAAMVNFLGLMGWSYGDDTEIFSLEQMISKFKFKDISLGGPIFDQVKLNWINQQYILKMDEQAFVDKIRDECFEPSYLRRIFPLMRERLERFDELVDKADFFFNGRLDYSALEVVPKGVAPKDMRKMLKLLAERFDAVDQWCKDEIDRVLNTLKEEMGWKPRDFFMPLRLVVTGRKDSPPLSETIEVLGPEIVKFRIRDYVQRHSKA